MRGETVELNQSHQKVESFSSPTQSTPSKVAPLASQMAVIISSCLDTPSPMMSGMTSHVGMVVVTIYREETVTTKPTVFCIFNMFECIHVTWTGSCYEAWFFSVSFGLGSLHEHSYFRVQLKKNNTRKPTTEKRLVRRKTNTLQMKSTHARVICVTYAHQSVS